MNNALQIMWQQTEIWRLIVAVCGGFIVGCIYFQSLRWCVNNLYKYKHKYLWFAIAAFCRILLFFGVMALLVQKNVVLVLVYIVSFLLSKFAFLIAEKQHYFTETEVQKEEPDEN